MEKDKLYYKVFLEVALVNSRHVFGFINISHIPYEKFQEIFSEQITDERYLFEDSKSYFIEQPLYEDFKVFFEESIPFRFDFTLFEYSVGFASVNVDRYKKDYYYTMPPMLK